MLCKLPGCHNTYITACHSLPLLHHFSLSLTHALFPNLFLFAHTHTHTSYIYIYSSFNLTLIVYFFSLSILHIHIKYFYFNLINIFDLINYLSFIIIFWVVKMHDVQVSFIYFLKILHISYFCFYIFWLKTVCLLYWTILRT